MKRKRSIKSNDDSMAMALSDTLLGTVGIGSITGAALILNQGVKPVASETPTNLSAIIADVTEDMNANANLIDKLQSELNRSRDEMAQARHDAANAKDYYESEISRSEKLLDLLDKKYQIVNSRASAEAAKFARYRESRSVRMVFVLDTSGSMGDGLEESRRVLGMLIETIPYALTSFEVGVVCHREENVSQHKLTKLVRQKDDSKSSIQSVEDFMRPFEPTAGRTRINQAVDLALTDLGEGTEVQSDIIVLCSDVGPGDIDGLDAVQANSLQMKLNTWANRPGYNRVVLSIYTPPRPESTPPDEPKHRAFFEALGRVNERSRFSTRLASMFPLTFQSSFVQED